MAVHQNAVLSVCQKEHRTFYVPLTHEQVYISCVPTNILKIQMFSLILKFMSERLYERFSKKIVLLVFHERGP